MWYLIALCLLVATSAPPAWASDIQPIASVQQQLARAAAAQSESDFQRVLDEMKAGSVTSYSELIPQLVYAMAHAKEKRDALVASVIIRRLNISQAQLASSLKPYRDTTDPRLKTEIENLLGK